MEKITPRQDSNIELRDGVGTQAPPSYDAPGTTTSRDGPHHAPLNSLPMDGQPKGPINGPPPAHMGQHQGGYPPQQAPPSVPLNLLQSQSAPVICPGCGTHGMTNVTPESGGFTHAIAALVCFVSCLGCIPYCITSLKDVHHRCSKCGIPLATFHRSGRTELHAFTQ